MTDGIQDRANLKQELELNYEGKLPLRILFHAGYSVKLKQKDIYRQTGSNIEDSNCIDIAEHFYSKYFRSPVC